MGVFGLWEDLVRFCSIWVLQILAYFEAFFSVLAFFIWCFWSLSGFNQVLSYLGFANFSLLGGFFLGFSLFSVLDFPSLLTLYTLPSVPVRNIIWNRNDTQYPWGVYASNGTGHPHGCWWSSSLSFSSYSDPLHAFYFKELWSQAPSAKKYLQRIMVITTKVSPIMVITTKVSQLLAPGSRRNGRHGGKRRLAYLGTFYRDILRLT